MLILLLGCGHFRPYESPCYGFLPVYVPSLRERVLVAGVDPCAPAAYLI